ERPAPTTMTLFLSPRRCILPGLATGASSGQTTIAAASAPCCSSSLRLRIIVSSPTLGCLEQAADPVPGTPLDRATSLRPLHFAENRYRSGYVRQLLTQQVTTAMQPPLDRRDGDRQMRGDLPHRPLVEVVEPQNGRVTVRELCQRCAHGNLLSG